MVKEKLTQVFARESPQPQRTAAAAAKAGAGAGGGGSQGAWAGGGGSQEAFATPGGRPRDSTGGHRERGRTYGGNRSGDRSISSFSGADRSRKVELFRIPNTAGAPRLEDTILGWNMWRRAFPNWLEAMGASIEASDSEENRMRKDKFGYGLIASMAVPSDPQSKDKQGDLLSFILDIPSSDNPDRVARTMLELERRYNGNDHNAARREVDEMLTLVQKGTIPKYITEVKRVFAAAKVRGSQLDDITQVVIIQKGITDVYLANRLEIMLDNNPNITPFKLLEWLANTDATAKTGPAARVGTGPLQYGRPAAFLTDDTVDFDHMGLCVAAMREEKAEYGLVVATKGPFKGVCYWCGKTGHRVVECPDQTAGKKRTYVPQRQAPGYGRKFYPRSTQMGLKGAAAALAANSPEKREIAAYMWSNELQHRPDSEAGNELSAFMAECDIDDPLITTALADRFTSFSDEPFVLIANESRKEVIDSGATTVVLANRADFVPGTYKEIDPPRIVGGLDAPAIGRGSALGRFKDEHGKFCNVKLGDALHVPALSIKTGGRVERLYSVKKMVESERGNRVNFEHGNSFAILGGKKFPISEGSLYTFSSEQDEEVALMLAQNEDTALMTEGRPVRDHQVPSRYKEVAVAPPRQRSKKLDKEEIGAKTVETHSTNTMSLPTAGAEHETEDLPGNDTVQELLNTEVTAQKGETGAMLMHRRLGHPSQDTIKRMVPGINMKDLDANCDTCRLAKSTKNPAGTGSLVRKERYGECWHIDYKGRIPTASHTGLRYVLTAVDDFTRTIVPIFTHTRQRPTMAFSKLLIMHPPPLNEMGIRVKVLFKLDNEFDSDEVRTWAASNGVVLEFSEPYMHNQMGVAERANRTLAVPARCALLDSNLPDSFWPNAYKHAADLYDIRPNKANPSMNPRGVSPYEMREGRPPSHTKMFRVFGCRAFAHIPEPLRRTFDAPAREGILIGLSESKKAYLIWMPSIKQKTGSIITTSNVTFDETRIRLPRGLTVLTHLAKIYPSFESHIDRGTEQDRDDNGGEEIERSEEDSLLLAWDKEETYNEGMLLACSMVAEEENEVALLAKDVDVDIPVSFKDSQTKLNAEDWREACITELSLHRETNTFVLVHKSQVPKGTKILPSVWAFDVKRTAANIIERLKARHCVKGCAQAPGSHGDTFAPTAKSASHKLLIALAAGLGLRLASFDVEVAFLSAPLMERPYFVKMAEGFEEFAEDGEPLVELLLTARYGLKESGRYFYKTLKNVLIKMGFKPCIPDPCVFVRLNAITGDTIAISVHVDDGLAIGTEEDLRLTFEELGKHLKINNTTSKGMHLGMQITYLKDGSISLSQENYIANLTKEHGEDLSKQVVLPMNANDRGQLEGEPLNAVEKTKYQAIIGGLTYASSMTRFDVSYAVNALARRCATPTTGAMKIARRVLQYLYWTRKKALVYRPFSAEEPSGVLIGWSDSAYKDDARTGRSTAGFAIGFKGSGALTVKTRLIKTVSLSTAEAELKALTDCAKKVQWFRNMLAALGQPVECPTVINEDNQGALMIAREMVSVNERSEHIDVREFYCRELVESGSIAVEYVATDRMVADTLTKPLPKEKFEDFSMKLMGSM